MVSVLELRWPRSDAWLVYLWADAERRPWLEWIYDTAVRTFHHIES